MTSEEVEEVLDVDALPGGARAALEAVLMIADEPISDIHLASTLKLPLERIRTELEGLVRDYSGAGDGPGRGFQLREVAGGRRIFSRPEHAPGGGKLGIDGHDEQSTRL